MRHLAFFILLAFLVSCTAPATQNTLRDIDVTGHRDNTKSETASQKNEADIRAAYAEYLKHASKNDVSRLDALQRLAQLEFNLSERLDKTKGKQTETTQDIADKIYDETLGRSIELLKTTLQDYPKSRGNDKVLYQLAKAYDQRGEYEQSITSLQRLVKEYPNSDYYVESEFRLAEYEFSKRQYSKAEDMYTDVIVSRKNSQYLENARYKRGWARYKQEYYQDAVEDFLSVIDLHNFSKYGALNTSQKNQFDEYFRAIGLSFSYLGGANSLNDYFKKHPDFKFIYHTYAHVSDIYMQQQRYSDAVKTLDNFILNHPKSIHVPQASIKILDNWKQGGFINKLLPALKQYYALYHPHSQYWEKSATDLGIYESVTEALKNYTVLAATFFHKEFDKNSKQEAFASASYWYDQYLKYNKSTASKDNINLLYAELLSAHADTTQALHYYELTAYDSDIILNKDAAYATILLSSKLYSHSGNSLVKQQYLDKFIRYSLLYVQLYPNDAQSEKILARASRVAYDASKYEQAIKLSELYAGTEFITGSYNIYMIKANAYFKLKQYEDAESAYQSILRHYKLDKNTRSKIIDNLAISIYNQGKFSENNGKFDDALHYYARIIDNAPSSNVAATGLYDAIALCMRNNMWEKAIYYIKQFQTAFPDSNLKQDVAKKLSIAYLNSHQDIAAANELLKISRNETDSNYKVAALWKAGALYESRNEWGSAIKTYEEYAKQYHRPYPQYVEAMNKLTTLYTRTNNIRQADHWRNSILEADRRTPEDLKSDRTKLLCSKSAIQLANELKFTYSEIRLTIPLKRSLENKKYYMQRAVNLYGRASSYGIPEISTEATYAIADIYQSFSKALLTSERPTNLSKTELDQYNILLEDKSFPFEDKSIEFFATNLRHVKDGIYDQWMEKSYAKLKQLYPERYDRDVKLEPYINVLH